MESAILAEQVTTIADERLISPPLDELIPALKRLDRLLEGAVAAATEAYGAESITDRLRGLYVTPEEAARLLKQEPGGSILWQPTAGDEEQELPAESRLAWLARAFGLSSFETDVIILALAPELDRRYERLYAFLQDHVGRRLPSVDLALHIFCADAAERLARRADFDSGAPLLRHGLLHLIPEAGNEEPTLLAQCIKLDEQIVRFLLYQGGLDKRLVPFCKITWPVEGIDDLPAANDALPDLTKTMALAWETYRPLRLHFHGPAGIGKRRAARALAGESGLPLLEVDLRRALIDDSSFKQILRLILRHAWFYGAVPYIEHLDAVCCDAQPAAYQQLLEGLAQDRGITILAGTKPWVPTGHAPLGLVSISFPMPDFEQRAACWRESLDDYGLEVEAEIVDALAGRFRLTPAQIAEASATVVNQPGKLIADELFAAARAQSGHDLGGLAQKIDPLYTWEDIVLPQDSLVQLREVCQRVKQRHRVLGDWGFDKKLSLGKGTNALFAGPSGTGKTMAAEIIANELGLDLYKIDLAGVVSKYIGETEKNLDRIFRAAQNANAILFFDEADALFGKRSEVRDSHDRYANIEISYLLQKMESYDGLSILATNLRRHLDEAFLRRLAFSVHFPFPDAASRLLIWQGIWPQQTPLAEDLKLDALAEQFKLSGGNIKNAALAAAFFAAEDDGLVTMDYLLHAVRREYQKLGRTLSETELDAARSNGRLEKAT